MPNDLKSRISTTAFAFRGYNVTNLGRTPQLLAHPVYGPILTDVLREASEITSEATLHKTDLIEKVRTHTESTLQTFMSDVAMIVAVEIAQVRILREVFDIEWDQARLAFGYSLGEVAALIASDVYQLADILPAPLSLARECAELGRDVRMGVVFSRGAELSIDRVTRLCLEINAEDKGVIAISSFLAPNAVILLGQRDTVAEFKRRMHDTLPKHVHLRGNKYRWPPLHTPILWEKGLPARANVVMHTMPGGFVAPKPELISLVTGKANYNDYNSREILGNWIDHPQRLWDAVCETMAAGVETVVHIGPEPNLVPATFKRLSDNVSAQVRGRSPARLGMRAMSSIVRRPWLTKVLSSRAMLLRAPFIEHIVLEDWLLEQSF